MKFSDKVYTLRKKKGLTQAELAKLTNVTQAAVQGYETGRVRPSKNTQIQLAKALNIKVDDLMDDERSIAE